MAELMDTIRFHETGDASVLRHEQLAIPDPGAGEVLVKVAAAGVNFADIVRRSGGFYPVPTPLPFNPGCEIAGEVIGCGPGVDARLLGAKVLAATTMGGGYATHIALPRDRLLPWPPGLDAPNAVALVVQGLTAALMIDRVGRLRPGETIFVPGATGGVGSLAVQIARARGAGLVIAGVGSADKCDDARALGADVALDYSDPSWPDRAVGATGGAGIDLFLDAGAGALLKQGCACAAPGGRLVIYGTQAPLPDAIPAPLLVGRGLAVHGFYLGAFLGSDPALASRTLRGLARLIEDGKLRPLIHATLPLSAAAEAHAMIEQHRARGKIVLVP